MFSKSVVFDICARIFRRDTSLIVHKDTRQPVNIPSLLIGTVLFQFRQFLSTLHGSVLKWSEKNRRLKCKLDKQSKVRLHRITRLK